ncbi:MAG: hypothetical protein Q7Q73_01185 [Verrucomicrobiota bacterium JB024]|nr:hypothetical protein [Verrucomicrobiota bacterium JB024]
MVTASLSETGPMGRLRWWQWPNILALDAVLIAVVWQHWLGYPGLAGSLVLALSVWLTYTGDRWLDVRGLPDEHIVTDRHRFARRWEKELAVIWVAVLVADIVLSLTGLTHQQFVTGLFMLGGCIAYSVAVHRHLRVPKEYLVALIFTLGTALYAAGQTPPLPLIPATSSLFLLAFANCSLIAFREMSIDVEMGRTSLARQHPGSRPWAFYALAAAGAISLYLGLTVAAQHLLVCVCAAGLFALGLAAERLPMELFRVLADTILLLPGLAFFIPGLHPASEAWLINVPGL